MKLIMTEEMISIYQNRDRKKYPYPLTALLYGIATTKVIAMMQLGCLVKDFDDLSIQCMQQQIVAEILGVD